jgi:ABC-type phosphate transport system permease subunit
VGAWRGEMIKIFIDVVLFSGMFALVTGVVLAAAHVLG